MTKSEWEKTERRIVKEYRKTLVHKARPMPQYKFFVPQPSLKMLTIPRSPNFIKPPKKSTKNKPATPEYSLPELPSYSLSPTTDGGSFLDYSTDAQWDREVYNSSSITPTARDDLTGEPMEVDNDK